MALPDDNPITGARLRPYVWLIDRTGGVPTMPTTITVSGQIVRLHDGKPRPIDIGGFPALEYRTAAGDRLFVIMRVANVSASGRTAMVAIAWFPTSALQAARDFWDQIEPQLTPLIQSWPCALAADGSVLVTALEAAAGPAATAAKSVWPANWRVLLPTDPQPGGPPTGPRIVGAVLAA
jgi:hypothetical protein